MDIVAWIKDTGLHTWLAESVGWFPYPTTLALHSAGMGIVVGYLINPPLGLAITVAVVLHEIPQGMTSALIMREAQWSRTGMLLALGLAGFLYPLGALLAGLIPAEFQQKMLAFIAGDFIYIAAGDLLPEAHRRFNWQVILSVLGGMALMFILKRLVPISGWCLSS